MSQVNITLNTNTVDINTTNNQIVVTDPTNPTTVNVVQPVTTIVEVITAGSIVQSIANNITNNVNNYILTATGGSTINGEVDLTFDGSLLNVAGQLQQGEGVSAIGNNSHAEGFNTQAIGNNSHAEGNTTKTGITTAFSATGRFAVLDGPPDRKSTLHQVDICTCMMKNLMEHMDMHHLK
jgi:hypothetical protein